jgi:hypothetical protein
MKEIHYHQSQLKFQNKIIEKGNSEVRVYKNATLITPGEWSDMKSMKAITYTPGELQKASNRWLKNTLNLDHEWKVLNTVGTIENCRWFNGAVIADLHINKITEAAKDTIALIDAGLINHLSVELQSEDFRDYDNHKILAKEIEFIGCAIIYGDLGACSQARIN